jgi:1-deoxy-D-xylulose-5-phosphate synthase
MLLKSMIIHGSMFEDMGFTYLGPVDGHDLKALCNLLQIAKGYSGPVLIHLTTVKGKGYKYSEERPSDYHGIAKFDVDSGKQYKISTADFSAVFGEKLTELASADHRVCAVTAAMQSATGLDLFAKKYPKRFYDVGIAEGHAVTMAAGMAAAGMLPVCAIYSTFLQRSYDMIIHDVALQNLHVVFAVDRAGLVGEDGETHQGVFDAVFLPQIPGMRVYCPSNYAELETMLEDALFKCDGPVAVRYPRGTEGSYKDISSGDSETIRSGADITLVSYGRLISEVSAAADLAMKSGISAEIVKMNIIAPLNVDEIVKSVQKTGRLIVAEETVDEGSVGRRILSELALRGVYPKTRLINLGSRFIPQGSVKELFRLCGIDAESISDAVREECGIEKKDRSAAV